MAKTTKTQEKQQFTDIQVDIIITATSNKSEGGFGQKIPSKTVYFRGATDKDVKTLIDFGLTPYETKDEETGEDVTFFITKAKAEIPVYKNARDFDTVDFSQNNKSNFNTDGQTIKASITHVIPKEKTLNDFYRLSALLDLAGDTLVEVEPRNPFAEMFEQ